MLPDTFCRRSGQSFWLLKILFKTAKTSEGFLTSESQNILTEYLDELKLAAYVCKIESPEHEYGLEYNLYRLLKRFGAKRHFYQYINDSYKKGLSKRT